MAAKNEKVVVLGADHNGVRLKAEVKKLLNGAGYVCVDIGPYDDTEKVDYVDYARTVGNVVSSGDAARGVLICGTGVGMSIVANRFPNVRASLAHSVEVAHKTREHNDANVLCLGAWVNPLDENLKIVEAWFLEPFGAGRHVQRVEKMKPHDKKKLVFANGVFDIVHPGHIELLKFAKSLGGKLVVGINSDRAVKLLKGPERPINDEQNRKEVLESLGFVDQVVVFDDVDTQDVIAALKPDVLVKGGEWTAEEVRERDRIPVEIEIKIFPLVTDPANKEKKYSTTAIIEKIRAKNVQP